MKAWLTLAAAVAFGIAPFVTEGFAGFTPDQFPIPQDNAPVQPAGYAFSIWSVIYLWLLLYAVMGVAKHARDPAWGKTYLPMAISMAIGAIWIKVATLSVIWATVLISAMLLTALWAVHLSQRATPRWACALPIGLYAGWLSAASCVALGLTGAGYGLLGDALFWGWMMVLVAIGFAWMNQRSLVGVWSYGLAVAWALIAVTIKNWDDAFGLAVFALIGAVMLAGLALKQTR